MLHISKQPLRIRATASHRRQFVMATYKIALATMASARMPARTVK